MMPATPLLRNCLKKLPLARAVVRRLRAFRDRHWRSLLGMDVPAAPAPAPAFSYPEGRFGRGQLHYRAGLPVLTVEGSPEEIGSQVGALSLGSAGPAELLADFLGRLAKDHPVLLKAGKKLLPQFPPDHRREMEAAARGAGIAPDLLVVANTVADIKRRAACSLLIVEPCRSATGAPLFGRNLDYLPQGNAHAYSLVLVCRPAGKHAFAAVTFPGLVGCMSGMNDAGLVLCGNEAYSANDSSPKFDPRGTPMPLCLRRVLEECTTVTEAAALLRSLKRAGRIGFGVCDRERAAVLEITPRSVIERTAVEGLCACTNHFRSRELATALDHPHPHYDLLIQAAALPAIGLSEVAARLHAVNLGARTIQTMIFEPASLRLHLSLGPGPTSARPLRRLRLAPLLRRRSLTGLHEATGP